MNITLDPIIAEYSGKTNKIRSLPSLGVYSSGGLSGGAYLMTNNGRLFHRVDIIIPQGNQQEKLAEINTIKIWGQTYGILLYKPEKPFSHRIHQSQVNLLSMKKPGIKPNTRRASQFKLIAEPPQHQR